MAGSLVPSSHLCRCDRFLPLTRAQSCCVSANPQTRANSQPVKQASNHPSISRPESHSSSFSSSSSPSPDTNNRQGPTASSVVNVVIMFWRPRNHYFPFRLNGAPADPALLCRQALTPARRFPGFSGRRRAGQPDESALGSLPLSLALRRE